MIRSKKKTVPYLKTYQYNLDKHMAMISGLNTTIFFSLKKAIRSRHEYK